MEADYNVDMDENFIDFMWAVQERSWVEAALIVEGYWGKGMFRQFLLMICTKSPDKEKCKEVGFKVAHTTVMHMLAHDKPTERSPAADHDAYMFVWQCVSKTMVGQVAVDVRQGIPGDGGKTALQNAALQNNEIAMCGLLAAGAGAL